MNSKDKARLRALKREIKRSGNKKVRHHLKKDLADNPEEAHLTQVDYGGCSSKKMNGADDQCRKKLYDTKNSGIMPLVEDSSHEKLFTVRHEEQASGESLPELCQPIREDQAGNETTRNETFFKQ